MKKKLAILWASILVISIFWGCTTHKSDIPKATVSTHTITASDDNVWSTANFLLPEKWTCHPGRAFRFYCDSDIDTLQFSDFNDKYACRLEISRYLDDPAADATFDESMQKVYEELFAGNTDVYQQYLQDMMAEIVLVSDFQSTIHNGRYGKIAEVRYTISGYNVDTENRIICIREDIPYEVTGNFSENVKPSSGDFALWVADSLKVDEHYTVEKDGTIKRKGW